MIFVLELDGSLCFDGHQIAEPIHQALDQLSLSHRLIFTTRHPLEEIGPWLKARWPASDVVSAQSAEQKYQDLYRLLAHQDYIALGSHATDVQVLAQAKYAIAVGNSALLQASIHESLKPEAAIIAARLLDFNF
ncbi:hypothetical protein [Haemophilus pittmaniae]|uniref:hypothetical protein n=1 Tax=Haemophilus pittmaniae TaxID=249188 RepID=UPI0028DB46B4|nr:hypothetical protein [Haemophilus pittmaniae]